MNIAIISDIHGNLVALEAVLADIANEAADQIVCLGDVAATGPQPQACLARLRALDCPVVRGNADDWLLNPQLSDEPDDFHRFIEEIDLWCVRQLSPEDLAYLRTFRPTVALSLRNDAEAAGAQADAGSTLLCFHGSPRANTDIIFATTPDDELAELLSGFQALILAGGHTHQQMVRRYRDMIVLNPGSVGLGYERDRDTGEPHNVGWAEYAWVRSNGGRFSVELRRVPVDVEAIVRSAFDSGMPHAARWAQSWQR